MGPDPDVDKTAEGARPTLLLVEDEPLITDLVETSLREAGFDVVAARDAPRAIEELERRPHTFCGLITDIRMSGGADGTLPIAHENSFPGCPSYTSLGTALPNGYPREYPTATWSKSRSRPLSSSSPFPTCSMQDRLLPEADFCDMAQWELQPSCRVKSLGWAKLD